MRYLLWTLLAVNTGLLIMNLLNGSAVWWISLLGIVAMIWALRSNAKHRRFMAEHRARMERSRVEFERRMDEIRQGPF